MISFSLLLAQRLSNVFFASREEDENQLSGVPPPRKFLSYYHFYS
jgi:hypothetical protein